MRFSLSSLFIRAAIACSIILMLFQVSWAKSAFALKPAPGWVRKIVPSKDVAGKGVSNEPSSTRVLDDLQIKVGDNSVERFFHYYQRVNTAAGLEDLSQLRFYYEPSYQQLAIHFVRILRGSATIDALRPSEIKVIHEEEELDQQLFNGTEAAVIFVNDVRVGDVIEYAFTLTGDNPVLGGRFTDTYYFVDQDPIQEFALRLLYPTKRSLAIKADNTDLQPTKQPLGEHTEYLWYAQNLRPLTFEDSTPDWFDPSPRVTLSEFQDWSAVVSWALPFYQNTSLKNSELRAKIQEWLERSSSAEDRTAWALQFVQDEIRYLGIELGRYSHQPTLPDKVFARRFGDCKDKSLLLSSILNAMGIDAVPALVSMDGKASVDTWQPTPFAFDHVIVQAKVSGKTYWLDPTISYQRAGITGYYDPPYERALVLREGTRNLESIPKPTADSGSLDIVESYSARNSTNQIYLSVTKTYRGSEADQIRYLLSASSLDELGRNHLNGYADNIPSITADGPPSVEDDLKSNTLVLKEKYLITELWKDGKHSFVADRVYSELSKPRVSQRSAPLAVRYPLAITQTILIDLGPGQDFFVDSDVLTDDALRFEYNYSKQGDKLSMYFSLKTFADYVPTHALKRHLDLLDRAQERVGMNLNHSATVMAMPTRRGSTTVLRLMGLVIVVPLVGALIWFLRRRTRIQRHKDFVDRMRSEPGTSPETALRLSSEEQIETFLKGYSCGCGTRPYNTDEPAKRERFSYDGHKLVGIRLHCPSCKRNSDLYLNPAFENELPG